MIEELREGGKASGSFIRNLLRILEMEVYDLGEMIGVLPSTVQKWVEGRKIDYGCAHVLIEMLWKHPREAVWLLAQRKENAKEIKDWPARIRETEEILGITRKDFLTLLGTSRWTFDAYESGEKEPAGCYGVLIDLLHDHPKETLDLLDWSSPEEVEWTTWDKKSLLTLLGRLGMTMSSLAGLLGVNPAAVREWAYGWSVPGPCTRILLALLDVSPANTLVALEEVREEGPVTWSGEDALRLRTDLGLSRPQLAELLGLSYGTLQEWETEGLPKKSACPGVLYGILNRHGRALVPVLIDLRS